MHAVGGRFPVLAMRVQSSRREKKAGRQKKNVKPRWRADGSTDLAAWPPRCTMARRCQPLRSIDSPKNGSTSSSVQQQLQDAMGSHRIASHHQPSLAITRLHRPFVRGTSAPSGVPLPATPPKHNTGAVISRNLQPHAIVTSITRRDPLEAFTLLGVALLLIAAAASRPSHTCSVHLKLSSQISTCPGNAPHIGQHLTLFGMTSIRLIHSTRRERASSGTAFPPPRRLEFHDWSSKEGGRGGKARLPRSRLAAARGSSDDEA